MTHHVYGMQSIPCFSIQAVRCSYLMIERKFAWFKSTGLAVFKINCSIILGEWFVQGFHQCSVTFMGVLEIQVYV